MQFDQYHFHIYFNRNQLSTLKTVLEKLEGLDNIQIGRIRETPIGPHPTGSCQISVKGGNVEKMLAWFLVERRGLDIFIHPLSGDEIKDHTDYTVWIGQPHQLNLNFFYRHK